MVAIIIIVVWWRRVVYWFHIAYTAPMRFRKSFITPFSFEHCLVKVRRAIVRKRDGCDKRFSLVQLRGFDSQSYTFSLPTSRVSFIGSLSLPPYPAIHLLTSHVYIDLRLSEVEARSNPGVYECSFVKTTQSAFIGPRR